MFRDSEHRMEWRKQHSSGQSTVLVQVGSVVSVDACTIDAT